VRDRVDEAMRGRAEIQAAPDNTARAIQEARHRALEERIKDIRLVGDSVIAAFLAEDKPRPRERKRAEVESWLGAAPVAWDKIAAHAAGLKQGAHPLVPFHWEIEFPEVFARQDSGFDAVVGNPPFLGGKRISTNLGDRYANWLTVQSPHASQNVDLVGHFFLHVLEKLRADAAFGLIASNTIRQGATREGALAKIITNGATIYRAINRLKWPGEAGVVVSVVHCKTGSSRQPVLNGRPVSRISAYLVEGTYDGSPAALAENEDHAFIGCYVLGMGFTFDDDTSNPRASSLTEMNELIRRNPRNSDVIFPYIGGEEVNNDPHHSHRRFVIDYFDRPLERRELSRRWEDMNDRERSSALRIGIVPTDYPGEVAADWPDLLEIVRKQVKPERDKQKRKALRIRWWQFAEKQRGLRQAIASLPFVFATNCGAAPHLAVARMPAGIVFAHTLSVFAFPEFAAFGVLQSRAHELWARFFASSMKDDLRYTPSDCFETFPFPGGYLASCTLGYTGQAYHDHRAAVLATRNEGMTKTYNRFHDAVETSADIQRLRELHASMDRAVLEAYGWHDLITRAEPLFLDETDEDDHTYQGRLFWPSDFRDEVLARLLALNSERHAEEVRLRIAPGMNGRTRDADDNEDEGDGA
jgi:hypothetical protein